MKPVVSRMESFIFASRWLQAPLYLGLIVAQAVYVFKFMRELMHLVTAANSMDETAIMLIVLGLIDVVMIANLLIMVVIGGYETFVSKIDSLEKHEDRPEWLSHVNAGVLKTKLALALISISSIHLLKTFIGLSLPNVTHPADYHSNVMWQVLIHCTFLISAVVMAFTDRLMQPKGH
ncbi:TIGR00645 family protein [Chitinimonas sp. PSY-7]|uniref:TIGR00645 family protein n=1 Tax=Chitinimonas sp. PSY-7 TaxID=3459088 RepID=UPI00404025AD